MEVQKKFPGSFPLFIAKGPYFIPRIIQILHNYLLLGKLELLRPGVCTNSFTLYSINLLSNRIKLQ